MFLRKAVASHSQLAHSPSLGNPLGTASCSGAAPYAGSTPGRGARTRPLCSLICPHRALRQPLGCGGLRVAVPAKHGFGDEAAESANAQI